MVNNVYSTEFSWSTNDYRPLGTPELTISGVPSKFHLFFVVFCAFSDSESLNSPKKAKNKQVKLEGTPEIVTSGVPRGL